MSTTGGPSTEGVDVTNSVSWRADHSVTEDDATWILTSAFIIFTMQSGFGLLESGSVSVKNELNIMVKNAVDVIFGGLSYWMFGYAFSFGESEPLSNPIIGWGNFFVDAKEEELGWVYSKFFFQASFATTATTIVSGAMAERTKLTSYMVFSTVNTLLFSLPAHWVWASNGWLYTYGVCDIAGAGPVHLVGGLTGLVATLILKPRHRRYDKNRPPQIMSSPTNAVLGMFMLWWGWLGFNCGSTFGISGVKWKLAARSAASTLCASVAGGIGGLLASYIVCDKKFNVSYMINGLLGSLVSITATCALVQPWQGLVIGLIGSLIANASVALLNKLKIDDPVGCVGTHAMPGAWALISAGLFARDDDLLQTLFLKNVRAGVFYGGGFRQLGIQMLAIVSIAVWTMTTAYICLKLIDCVMGLRVSLTEEIIGADIVEHGLGDVVYDRTTGSITYPEYSDDEAELSGLNDSSQERHLNQVRNRSLSRVPHLLGHHMVKRTGEELRKEIERESFRQRSNAASSNAGRRKSLWNILTGIRKRTLNQVDKNETITIPANNNKRASVANAHFKEYNGNAASTEHNNGYDEVHHYSNISGNIDSALTNDDVIIYMPDCVPSIRLQKPATFNDVVYPSTSTTEVTHI